MEKAVVFELNTSAGFYSEFFFLCQSYIYAKKNNLKFFIKMNNWPYTYSKGWHDYFESLTVYDKNIHNYEIILLKHNQTSIITDKFTTEEYINCIKEIYILKKELVLKANEYNKNFGNYISIYVRRGDKFTEALRTSEDNIIKNIKYNEKTNFFIQTDDYTVIENFEKILNNKIFTIINPKNRGSYHNNGYINKDKINPYIKSIIPRVERQKEQIKEDTEEMLVGLLICILSDECWTDDTSNVGRFLMLSKNNNIYSYSNKKIIDLQKKIEPMRNI
jgi:hypothetical protein